MLHDRSRGRYAHAEGVAHDNLEEREGHHDRQGDAGDRILERGERSDHRAGPGWVFCFLNVSRALRARSKMSPGTISPRIVAASTSPSWRHSGPLAFVTVRPCCCISITAKASCLGTSS